MEIKFNFFQQQTEKFYLKKTIHKLFLLKYIYKPNLWLIHIWHVYKWYSSLFKQVTHV